MANLAAPQNFPIRRVTDTHQKNGRIVNPVRMMEIGGLDAMSKWPATDAARMKVEKPSVGVGKVKSDYQSQEGV